MNVGMHVWVWIGVRFGAPLGACSYLGSVRSLGRQGLVVTRTFGRALFRSVVFLRFSCGREEVFVVLIRVVLRHIVISFSNVAVGATVRAAFVDAGIGALHAPTGVALVFVFPSKCEVAYGSFRRLVVGTRSAQGTRIDRVCLSYAYVRLGEANVRHFFGKYHRLLGVHFR